MEKAITLKEEIRRNMEALPEIDWENKNRKVIAAVNRLLYDAFPKAPKGSIRACKSQVLKDWSEKHQGG